MNNKNQLILENMQLAEKIAKSKKRKIHSSVSYDELKSAAYFGLTEAANSFDPQFGVPFCLYACKKIVWSIVNYLRELCWSTKNHKIKIVTLSEFIPHNTNLSDFFVFDLDFLDELQKKIVYFKINARMKNREIARILNFSESRVSQIMAEIKKKLQQ